MESYTGKGCDVQEKEGGGDAEGKRKRMGVIGGFDPVEDVKCG